MGRLVKIKENKSETKVTKWKPTMKPMISHVITMGSRDTLLLRAPDS